MSFQFNFTRTRARVLGESEVVQARIETPTTVYQLILHRLSVWIDPNIMKERNRIQSQILARELVPDGRLLMSAMALKTLIRCK